jgi:hypothetical protein
MLGGLFAVSADSASADGAVVLRGYDCNIGGSAAAVSIAVLTPSGHAQSFCHAGPDTTPAGGGGGADVFIDVNCFTLLGLGNESTFVFTPSGGANAFCHDGPD